MLRADVANTLTMIQPSLVAYSFNAPPQPVMLDSGSITPDRILLLDSFFKVIIFHCGQIANWKKLRYHEQEQYASFKQLLQCPLDDAVVSLYFVGDF